MAQSSSLKKYCLCYIFRSSTLSPIFQFSLVTKKWYLYFYLVLFHLDRKKPSLELLNRFAYPEWVITHSLRKTAPLCSQELILLGSPCCPQVRTLTANPDSLQQSCSRPFIIIIILQLYVACHSLSASQWFDRKREVCICAFSAVVVTLEQLLPDSNQLNLSSAELGVS